jgi:predicted small lipoprotein YifL
MKKTFLSLAVAAFFAFALVSCGTQGTDADLQDETEVVEPDMDDIEPEIDEPETGEEPAAE